MSLQLPSADYISNRVITPDFSRELYAPGRLGPRISLSQDIAVCPYQDYTAQVFMRIATSYQVSCTAKLCVSWASAIGEAPGTYCSDGHQLTSNYTMIQSTYPANINKDHLTNASISIQVGCAPLPLPTDSDPFELSQQIPSAVIYVDDVVMINQAYPDAYALPTANPTSVTACDAVPSGAGTSGTGTRIPATTITSSIIPTATVFQAYGCGGNTASLVMGMHDSIQDLRRRVRVIMDRNQQSITGTQQNISSAATESSQTTSLQADSTYYSRNKEICSLCCLISAR